MPRDIRTNHTIDDSSGLITAFEVAAATLAAFVIVATLVWQTNHYFAMPLYDDISDRLRLYRALPSTSSLLQYFGSSPTEHPISSTRLLPFSDHSPFPPPAYPHLPPP